MNFWIRTIARRKYHLGCGPVCSKSEQVGEFDSFLEADAAAYQYAKGEVRRNPSRISEAWEVVALAANT